MKVVKGAIIVMKAEKTSSKLFMPQGHALKYGDATVASTNQEESTIKWHYKLGHVLERGIKILAASNPLPGLTSVNLPFCEHCIVSKQSRLRFGRSAAKSKHILDLIHSDVWESPVTSLGGAKYFISFIDDYSRRIWVHPIKKKSDEAQVKLES